MPAGGGVSNVGLGMTFSARDLASGPIGLLSGNFSRLHQSVRGGMPMMLAGFAALAASATMLVAGLAGIRGSFDVAEFAGTFEQSMARIGGVTQASAETLDQLTDSALAAGQATQFSPEEASEGLMSLSTAGFQAAESMELLTPALALAAGGSISVGDASSATASAVRVFSLSMDEAGTAADRLLAITTRTQLQASELSLALGTVGRGASAAGQNLDSMLVSMGLVRNTGVQASVAASSVSSALLFMARNASKFTRLGVSITDAAGNFRDFNDIVLETSSALESRYTNQAERAAAATELFGRFGITAFQAISNQARAGVRDAEGNIHRGAAAIQNLMASQRDSVGLAADMADRVLRDFRGQTQLLAGSIQTLGTVVGITFGQIFVPMINLVRVAVNALISTWRAIPEGFRTFIGVAFLAVSALSVLAGGFGVIIGVIILVAATLGELLIVFGAVAAGIALAMVPVFAAFAALMAVGATLRRAWQRNLGGLQDFTTRWASRLSRMWRGLSEIFTSGRLSNGLYQELRDADEGNLLNMLQHIQEFVRNAGQMWEGFRDGFNDALEEMRPDITAFASALEDLGVQFLDTTGSLAETANAAGAEGFRDAGRTMGQSIGGALSGMIQMLTRLIPLLTRVLAFLDSDGWRDFATVIGAIASIIETIVLLFGRLNVIANAVNPLTWINALSQLGRGQDVTAFGSLRTGTQANMEERFSAIGRDDPESMDTIGRATPIARRLDQSRGSNVRDMLREQDNERRARRAQPLSLRLRNQMVVDGRVLAESVGRVNTDNAANSGALLFEGPQSTPGQ